MGATDRVYVLSGPRASLIGHDPIAEPGMDHGQVTATRRAIYESRLNRSGCDGAPPAKVPFGAVRPRCRHPAAVATRPRGVRASIPVRTRNVSHTSSTVSGCSPTATAWVVRPTGP